MPFGATEHKDNERDFQVPGGNEQAVRPFGGLSRDTRGQEEGLLTGRAWICVPPGSEGLENHLE